MWVSKKKWNETMKRLEVLERVLLHVELGTQFAVFKKGDGCWGTGSYGPHLLGITKGKEYVSAVTMIQFLLLKLGLVATRSEEGIFLITEIPKADGGTTGRAKDGRFSKKS